MSTWKPQISVFSRFDVHAAVLVMFDPLKLQSHKHGNAAQLLRDDKALQAPLHFCSVPGNLSQRLEHTVDKLLSSAALQCCESMRGGAFCSILLCVHREALWLCAQGCATA